MTIVKIINTIFAMGVSTCVLIFLKRTKNNKNDEKQNRFRFRGKVPFNQTIELGIDIDETDAI